MTMILITVAIFPGIKWLLFSKHSLRRSPNQTNMGKQEQISSLLSQTPIQIISLVFRNLSSLSMILSNPYETIPQDTYLFSYFLFRILNYPKQALLLHTQICQQKLLFLNTSKIKQMINKVFILSLCVFLCFNISNGSKTSKRLLLNVNEKTRTNTLRQRCPIPRVQFYNSQKNESLSYPRTQTAQAINLNGDDLIYSIITNNGTLSQNQINKSLRGLIVYFIFIVIGLAILILIAPFLICCVCCPLQCPPCASIRHQPGQIYSKGQMKWPGIIVIILCLIVLGTGIAILIVNGNLQKGYSETRCSIAMLFDDILNGNFTKDGKAYWMGLHPLNISFLSPVNLTAQKQANLTPQKSLGQIIGNITTLFRRYASLVNAVQKQDQTIDKNFSTTQNVAINPILIVTYIIAGLAILISIILIISACCICQYDKFSARKIIYPSCLLVWLLGLLFFLLAIITSATTIAIHYGCRYIEVGLQTKAQFKYRFQPIFNNKILTQMVSECASQQGSGILIDYNLTNINQVASQGINNLTNLKQSGNITQLNCKVLGQDSRLIVDTFCTQIFHYSYSMRILSIIISFSLLLLFIFITFLAVRAYKSHYHKRDQFQNQEQPYPIHKPHTQENLKNANPQIYF